MKQSNRFFLFSLGLAAMGCGSEPRPPTPGEASGTTSSSTIALTRDDSALWVANQDSDSVSVIDPKARTLLAEIPLGAAPPSVDPATKRFDLRVSPRALAIVDSKK